MAWEWTGAAAAGAIGVGGWVFAFVQLRNHAQERTSALRSSIFAKRLEIYEKLTAQNTVMQDVFSHLDSGLEYDASEALTNFLARFQNAYEDQSHTVRSSYYVATTNVLVAFRRYQTHAIDALTIAGEIANEPGADDIQRLRAKIDLASSALNAIPTAMREDLGVEQLSTELSSLIGDAE